MKSISNHEPSPQALAPVVVTNNEEDAVAHSLRILSTVYNYNHWIYSLIRDFIGNCVLEVGSGIGNITRFLIASDNLVCLEPVEEYKAYLINRLADHKNAHVIDDMIQNCPNEKVPPCSMDTVVCLNVLEHIENDQEALQAMQRTLKPGGKLVLVVPALQCIYGQMDKAMEHYRRYSRKKLADMMNKASLDVVFSRYFNFPGAFAWWWQGKILGKNRIPERATLLFDRMVPALSALESIIRPPIGQSIVIIGQKRR